MRVVQSRKVGKNIVLSPFDSRIGQLGSGGGVAEDTRVSGARQFFQKGKNLRSGPGGSERNFGGRPAGMAQRFAHRVRSTHEPMQLETMPPNERRIIHMELAEDPDVETESTGEGEMRRVVIRPKR